jgi:hypothetical protein
MRSVIQGGLGLSSWRGCVFTRKVPIRTVALCVPLCVREIASPLPQTSVVPDNHRSARWGVMTAHIREWLCCLRATSVYLEAHPMLDDSDDGRLGQSP